MKKVYIYIGLVVAGAIVFFYLAASGKNSLNNGIEKKSIFNSIKSAFSTNTETQSLNINEYISWCENPENGLINSKQIGNFNYSAFYKPLNYLALKEINYTEPFVKSKFESAFKEYGNMQYVSFRITDTKGNQELLKSSIRNESEYYARLEYLSFKMQQDFKLIDGKDTLPCTLYHFERVYGLAPYATFVLGFPESKNKDSDKQIVYEDNLFNSGIIYLTFNKDVLSNLPKLKF